jgi:hypothetical protein
VKHIRSINSKARRIEAYVAGLNAAAANRTRRWMARQRSAAASPEPALPVALQRVRRARGAAAAGTETAAHSRSAARSSSRRAGRRTAAAAPPDSASRSSATCSTATSAASGRRTCRISYNHAPDWTGTCAAAQKDWRKIDLIFP